VGRVVMGIAGVVVIGIVGRVVMGIVREAVNEKSALLACSLSKPILEAITIINHITI
jgi:hypothetical protein